VQGDYTVHYLFKFSLLPVYPSASLCVYSLRGLLTVYAKKINWFYLGIGSILKAHFHIRFIFFKFNITI